MKDISTHSFRDIARKLLFVEYHGESITFLVCLSLLLYLNLLLSLVTVMHSHVYPERIEANICTINIHQGKNSFKYLCFLHS